MIKFILKSFFYISILIFTVLLFFIIFVNYKLKDETTGYMALVDKVNQLSDTYILCMGLNIQNPNLENKLLCEGIKDNLEESLILLKTEYPYLNFYSNVVKTN